MIPINITNPVSPEPDMTTTAQQTVVDSNQQSKPPIKPVDPKIETRNREFRQRIDTSKQYRRKLIANWTISIDYRRGKPFSSQTDEDQIAVPLDWSLTKSKQAALFSQVPQVRIDHPPQTTQVEWAQPFEQKLNDNLKEAGLESAMDEILPDCINASGIGVALVAYEAITENKLVPKIDISQLPPEIQSQVLQSGKLNGQPIEMEEVPSVVDRRYLVQRISPADLLWPVQYTGSNFDSAPWIGRSGRVTWADAVKKFNLKEEDKESILGEDRPMQDKLTHDVEKDKTSADHMVGFDELFYREFQYDENAKSFDTIHHLVFVSGKEDPVIDEPWRGQKLDEQYGLIGSKKYPIRILTLTYITDETIPPSDSAIGRSQVNEINKARTQMIKQRERSLPVRWFDVNRIDPTIQQSLMRGTWQAMIPVQGEGTRVIGEVARATMPQENFLFDKIAKTDLAEEWSVSAPEKEGEEPTPAQANFQARIGRERAKVSALVVSIAEVLGGLMCLYEDPSSFGNGFDPSFSKGLCYSVLADSTVLVDAVQRLSRLNDFIDMYGKSGWVNLEPVLKEVATLAGLDPNLVIKRPDPKSAVEPNISLRLTGVEDMLNPLTLAFLIKSGQAPDTQTIEQAKALIQQAVVPPQTPEGSGMPQSPGQLPPPGQAPPPDEPLPHPPIPHPGEANEQWSAMPKITKRSEEGKNQ